MPLSGFIDRQNLEWLSVLLGEGIHTNNLGVPGFDRVLVLVACVGDFRLREASFNGRDHAAHVVNAADVLVRELLHFMGERFDKVAAAERVGYRRDAALVRDRLLGSKSDRDRMLAR